MKATASIVLMLLPIAFGIWACAFPDVGPVPIRIVVWTCLSLACLVWGVLIRRQHRALGWCCIIVCCLQALLFLLPTLVSPGKTKRSTAIIQRGSKTWQPTPVGRLIGFPLRLPGPAALSLRRHRAP